jgi:hypothetical protein
MMMAHNINSISETVYNFTRETHVLSSLVEITSTNE